MLDIDSDTTSGILGQIALVKSAQENPIRNTPIIGLTRYKEIKKHNPIIAEVSVSWDLCPQKSIKKPQVKNNNQIPKNGNTTPANIKGRLI